MNNDKLLQNHSLPADPSKYLSKARQAGQYLSQILHSCECRGICGDVNCSKLYRLITHCMHCSLHDKCVISGCFTTLSLINHRQNCCKEEAAAKTFGILKAECLICTFASKCPLVSVPTRMNDDDSPSMPPSSSVSVSVPMSLSSITPSSGRSTSMCHTNEKILRDEEFARPTMLPRRFRCVSATEVELNTVGHGMFNCQINDKELSRSIQYDARNKYQSSSYPSSQSSLRIGPRDRIDSI